MSISSLVSWVWSATHGGCCTVLVKCWLLKPLVLPLWCSYVDCSHISCPNCMMLMVWLLKLLMPQMLMFMCWYPVLENIHTLTPNVSLRLHPCSIVFTVISVTDTRADRISVFQIKVHTNKFLLCTHHEVSLCSVHIICVLGHCKSSLACMLIYKPDDHMFESLSSQQFFPIHLGLLGQLII